MVDRTAAFEYARDLFNELVDYGMNPCDPGSIQHIDLPDGVDYASGATRIVMWRFNSNFVIKMPWDRDDNRYCERECEIYSDAVERGVDQYFGWCDCAITPEENNGFGVYVMEFLDCDEEGISDDSMDLAFKEYCAENQCENNSENRDTFINEYYDSDEDCEAPLNFLLSRINDCTIRRALDRFICDENISDIHSANVGYRGDILVFCDYASYGWI